MLVYYDAATGAPTYSISLPADQALPGAFIEVENVPADLSAFRVESGALVEHDISAAVAAALRSADRIVEDFRLAYITEIAGQGTVYRWKYDEAVAYLAADPAPLPEDLPTLYPHLAEETGITAQTPYQLAQLWANLHQITWHLSPKTEGARALAKDRIGAAQTLQDVADALDGLRTDLAELVP
ncbi:hypothetical protein J4E08_24090 [Sagittula sp. NFXS13]|uniref:hypothetical protein n=1 Tax=Sagittula sp. NFXS13 TaxID=2819095 RepID=UPI0032DE8A1E